jgi:hypothetical protein
VLRILIRSFILLVGFRNVEQSVSRLSDLNDSATDLGVDPQVMDELKKDQKIYQPQHEPGQSENFVANESRLKYFTDVLKLKLNKYGQLTTRRPRSPSHRIPLALPLGGFIRFYWPGKMNCCGQVHENSVSLEEHISRQHKPPRPFPEFSLVSEDDDDDEDGIESDATDCLLPADYPSVGKHSMEVTTPNSKISRRNHLQLTTNPRILQGARIQPKGKENTRTDSWMIKIIFFRNIKLAILKVSANTNHLF